MPLLRNLLLLGLLGLAGVAHAGEITVSAAASLADAFREIAADYELAHPDTKVRLNFGASGSLLQQIANGAPVDVFASADGQTMDLAVSQGLVDNRARRDFAGNALVLVVPSDAKVVVRGLRDLGAPAVRRLGLGNPASVPAGRYARAALEAERLWPALQAKAVLAQNVRQVLDYVARGEVDAGFVYATDAAAAQDTVTAVATVVLAAPIRYPIAPVRASANADEAAGFIAYVLSPAGQRVLARHGFRQP